MIATTMRFYDLQFADEGFVEKSYAVDTAGIYCRIIDHSLGGQVSYERALWPTDRDAIDEFQPWDGQIPHGLEWEEVEKTQIPDEK